MPPFPSTAPILPPLNPPLAVAPSPIAAPATQRFSASRKSNPLSSDNLVITSRSSSSSSTSRTNAPGSSKYEDAATLRMDFEFARASTDSASFEPTPSPPGSGSGGGGGSSGGGSVVFDDDTIKRINDEFELLNVQYQADLNQQIQNGVMLFASATTRNNYHKNRYSNILATEATRVRLIAHRDLFLDSDYINANYIDGEIPGSKKSYIACQAPLSSTLSHFWLMIWENECPVVVMLTRLCERERVKATAYWPEDVGAKKHFGPFAVTFLKGKIVSTHLELRVFEVEYHGQTRNIVQLHYTEWPDFGTPASTHTMGELVALMDVYKMKGKLSGLNGPVVAHCSAGVGRAGTFIAIHICLEKMKYFNSLEQVIDVPRTVMMLRQSRTGMVQTAEQYRFIYEVVRDARQEFKERSQRVFAAPGSSSSELAERTEQFKRPYGTKRSKMGGAREPRSLRNSCAACYTVSSSMSASDASSSPFSLADITASASAMETSTTADLFFSTSTAAQDERRKAFVDKKRRLSFSRS